MKNSWKVIFAAAFMVAALSSIHAAAQTVRINAIGSSAFFFDAGLGASSSTSGGIRATCVWSENTNSVFASDSTTGTALTDAGSAWVAWTKGTGGSCATPSSDASIYAYLQTDSVVGNRCLFNAKVPGTAAAGCTISYPTTNPAPAGLILGTSNEVNLPINVANLLNSSNVNAAATDIRPEDAAFATRRATTACGTPVASGSQYLGLGYAVGGEIRTAYSSNVSHVIPFTLPGSFTVTPVGATPILVVVNGDGTSSGFSNSSIKSISSTTLVKFLDGSYTHTTQVNSSTDTSGATANVFLQDPLSGTYNVMEYNAPNTTVNQTSQDVGLGQSSALQNCDGNGGVKTNPLSIGARNRTIGTAQELSQVLATANSLGYGFWSVANFKSYTGSGSAANAKYLLVDGIDPLNSSITTSNYTGKVPVTGSTDLANVDLLNLTGSTADGGYPLWSIIRLVNLGGTSTYVSNLASAAQAFVNFGTTTSHPDFLTPGNLGVVRSHFNPPTFSFTPANGHVGTSSSACTATESGGDVGGVVYYLTRDSQYCTTNHVTTGQTGQRL